MIPLGTHEPWGSQRGAMSLWTAMSAIKGTYQVSAGPIARAGCWIGSDGT